MKLWNNQVRRQKERLMRVTNESFSLATGYLTARLLLLVWSWGLVLKSYTLLCYEPEAMSESSLEAKTNTG